MRTKENDKYALWWWLHGHRGDGGGERGVSNHRAAMRRNILKDSLPFKRFYASFGTPGYGLVRAGKCFPLYNSRRSEAGNATLSSFVEVNAVSLPYHAISRDLFSHPVRNLFIYPLCLALSLTLCFGFLIAVFVSVCNLFVAVVGGPSIP